MIERFIAFRYFRTGRGSGMITAISVVSFLGIMLGTAALIVVLSVFNGFSSLVQEFLLSVEPDIRILVHHQLDETESSKLSEMLSNKQISQKSPIVFGTVMVMHRNARSIVTVKGVSQDAITTLYRLKKKIVSGTAQVQGSNFVSSVLVGMNLSDRLGVLPGDTLIIVSPEAVEQSIAAGSFMAIQRAVVSGIFQSDNIENDGTLIFSDLETGSLLFPLSRNNGIMGYEIKLDKREDADDMQKSLQNSLPFAEVLTYKDIRKELFSVMEIERFVSGVLLSLIIVVAVFNILASLTMAIVKKQRDIGVLMALGLKPSSIRKIFFLQGIFSGFIGTIIGYALALFVYYLQIQYKIYPLDPVKFKLDAMPMQLRLEDFIVVGGVSLLLSACASYYPTKKAASTDPIQSIRWE